METPTVRLGYPFFRRPINVVLTTVVGVLIYTALGYTFAPQQFTTAGEGWDAVLVSILVDNLLIETLTVLILFRLVIGYAHLFRLDHVHFDARSVVRYQLAFLPLVFLAFFVFNPVTQTTRFLFRYFPDYDWSVYWSQYFFNLPLYLTYVGITFPLLYAGLNVNLVLEYGRAVMDRKSSGGSPAPADSEGYLTRIVGQQGGLERPVPVAEVLWFEVEERVYFARTPQGRHRVGMTMAELDAALDPASFCRINRSVIVNIDRVESFAPWINGKYVVRMKDAARTEFTLSRSRAATFKQRLGTA